jgi:hypothetical protein
MNTVGLKQLAAIDEWVEKAFGRKWSLAYQLNKAWYERPIYYKSNRFSVVGTGAEIRMPPYTQQLDYELEWGVFIGKQGVNIPQEQARDNRRRFTRANSSVPAPVPERKGAAAGSRWAGS